MDAFILGHPVFITVVEYQGSLTLITCYSILNIGYFLGTPSYPTLTTPLPGLARGWMWVGGAGVVAPLFDVMTVTE